MATLNVSFSADNGIYQGTQKDGSGNVVLAPQSLRSTYTGDTGYWTLGSISGSTAWTVNEDSVSVTVPSGSENYLEGYAVLDGGGYTEVEYRITLSGNNPDGTSNIQWTVTDNTGATIANDNPNLPIGEFGPQQFVFTATATGGNTISHVTLEVYVHGDSSITASDGELIPVSGGSPTSNTWGVWTSDVVDLASSASVAVSGTGISLKHAGYYYEDLSNVDNANSVAHSTEILSKYDILVCNEPSLNTGRALDVQTALVNAGVKLYGYNNVGVSESSNNYCIPSEATVKAIIDRCASNGYAGVFFDAAGFGAIPVEYMNDLVTYAHGKGLNVIANAHPQDIISTTVDTSTLTAPTTAPTLTAVTDANSTLPPGTYEVTYTLTNYEGETPASNTASVTVASGQGIQVSAITGFDSNAQGINIYLSIAAGSSTLGLVQSGNGSQVTLESLPVSGAAQPPSTNTAYVSNHAGIASMLGANDWCLWESFFSRSDNKYAGVPEGNFLAAFTSYAEGAQLAKQHGVQLMGLSYQITSIAITDYSDWQKAWVLAGGLGFKALAYEGSTSSVERPWATAPTFPALGNTLSTTMQASYDNTYEAVTDQGIIQFTAVDSPLSRSYKVFANNDSYRATVTSKPSTSATKVDTQYQMSSDRQTWTDIPNLNQVTERYARLQLTLQS